jgi:hypothetical protein
LAVQSSQEKKLKRRGNKRREKGVLAALAGWLVLPLSFFFTPSLPLLLTLLLGLFVCGMFVASSMFWDKTRVRHKRIKFEIFWQNKQGLYFRIA